MSNTEVDLTPPEDLNEPVVGQGYVTPSQKQALNQVRSQVTAEILGETAPLQSDIRQLKRQQGRAVSDVESLFGGIQGDVDASATRLKDALDESIALEQAIFGEVNSRLSALQQQRAADAQALAQQIGGYVPLSTFQDPVTMEARLGAIEMGGNLLSLSGQRDSAVELAEAFAGRVFPQMRAREIQDTRNFFRDAIKRKQDEITAIKKTKKGRINERLRERLLEDRSFELERLKADRDFALSKQGAQRDWWLAQKGLQIEAKRIDAELERLQAEIDAAKAAQERDIEATAEEKKKDRDFQAKQAALEAKRRAALEKQKRKTNQQLFQVNMKQSAGQILSALMNPEVKTISTPVAVPVTPDTPNAIQLITGEWVIFQNQPQQVGGQPITNRDRLIQEVVTRLGIDPSKNQNIFKWIVEQSGNALAAAGIDITRGADLPTQARTGPKGIPLVPGAKVKVPKLDQMGLPAIEVWASNNLGFTGQYPNDVYKSGNARKINEAKKRWLKTWINRSVSRLKTKGLGER